MNLGGNIAHEYLLIQSVSALSSINTVSDGVFRENV